MPPRGVHNSHCYLRLNIFSFGGVISALYQTWSVRSLDSCPILLLGGHFFHFGKCRYCLYWCFINIWGCKARKICLNLKISVEWLQSVNLFSWLSSPMRNLTIHQQCWIYLVTGPLGRERSIRTYLPLLALTRASIIGALSDPLLIALFAFTCLLNERFLPLLKYIQRFLFEYICIKSSILFFEIISLIFRPFLLPLQPGFTVNFWFRLSKGLLVSDLAFVYC